MDKLTPLEKALLHELEKHMSASRSSGVSETQSLSGLAATLKTLSIEFARIGARQTEIENRLDRLTKALTTQNSSMENLITQVNALLNERED